ncbi:RlpA-like double-psi beta-barrel-protein domain-containing protein-containing protein [Xylariaceae sp. FL0804]|nr:RlpA-like double-psi beta-barrel-protein domain-containing protein-containing protein [Xylariaceae sp. FL0804]
MKTFVAVLASAAGAAAISGNATTTHYFDGLEGACGCGSSSGEDSWELGSASTFYTAAGSPALFGDGSWCGSGCGTCYQLTSTGNAPCSTCGTGGDAGQSITVMVTNLCPNAGNAQWCPEAGATNEYGYGYHFDIMAESEVFGDNPVVSFESVDCPSGAASDYAQCTCAASASAAEATAFVAAAADPPPAAAAATPVPTTMATKAAAKAACGAKAVATGV